MRRTTLAVIASVFLCCYVTAQVKPPKHQRHWHHGDAENYEQRFIDLKCALVLIQAGPKLGTGFYISADGDIATASHVLGERTFSKNPDNTVKITFAMPGTLTITNSKGEHIQVSSQNVESNPDAWLADVARIKTGTPVACWLKEADDKDSRPGEHLVSLGFPGLSFQTLTIYSGIMSARLTTNLPTVILDTGEAIPPANEFVRVQMPISTGLSGAPVINDKNEAIAVVTNAGGWTQDLDHLLLAFNGGAFTLPPPPAARSESTAQHANFHSESGR